MVRMRSHERIIWKKKGVGKHFIRWKKCLIFKGLRLVSGLKSRGMARVP